MIHPTFQVSEELYIHAAREAVWDHVTRLRDWPQWRTDVTKATWVQGQRWQEGAQFALYSADGGQPQQFIIRMVVPADTTVWESSSSQGMVYSLHLVDQVGGCKVTLRCTFHGWGSLLKRLNAAGERTGLHAALATLKTAVERPDSRR